MSDEIGGAAAAYLDEAQPKASPWTSGEARAWIDTSREREAKALRAALGYLGLSPKASGTVDGQSGEAD